MFEPKAPKETKNAQIIFDLDASGVVIPHNQICNQSLRMSFSASYAVNKQHKLISFSMYLFQKSLNTIWEVKVDPSKSGFLSVLKERLFSFGIIIAIAFI